MRMVVLGQVVSFGNTWMAELDLDGGVADVELFAQLRLKFSHDMFRIGQRLVFDHDVRAQRRMLRRDRPLVGTVTLSASRELLDQNETTRHR